MADYPILLVLATGKPGVVNASNFGTIPKLKVSDTLDVTNNITVGGTVDGVDIATRDGVLTTLGTNFSTHDGGTALAQHSAIGDHTHASAGAQGGTIDHGDTTGRTDDDHSGYPLGVGRSGGQTLKGGTASGDDLTLESTAHGTKGQIIVLDELSMSSKKIVSLLDPTTDQEAATKIYVDTKVAATATGLDPKGSVDAATTAALPAVTASGHEVGKTLTADAVGVLTVDGVTILLNDFLLVKNQATGADNGRYKCTTEGEAGVAFVLTRAIDSDQDAEVTTGLYIYVEEGTVNAKSAWILTTTDPVEVDTTAWVMELFMTAGIIVAGTGASMTGDTLNVGGGDGIVANADNVAVELATNPGLQMTANKLDLKIAANTGLSKDGSGLAVDLVAAGAGTGGLEFSGGDIQIKTDGTKGLTLTTTGIEVELSGTTLQVAAGGLSVKGLPSLFEINGSAVSANVTKTNLDALTGGGATALHSHTGTSPHGPSSHTEGTGWRMVYQDVDGDDVEFALGANGTFLESNGASAAPAFRALTESDISDLGDTICLDSELTTHAGLDTGVHGAGASTLATAADIATHAGESDPHTGYRLETADHSHETTGAQAGKIDHGAALNGLGDDDHTQYIRHALATAASDFLAASGSGAFVKKTLGETATILEAELDHGSIQGLDGDDHTQYHNDARAVTWHDADNHSDLVNDDLTWTGEQTMDVAIGNGDYVGFQIPRQVGAGGITAADILAYDGTGKLIRRSSADQIVAGIAAASAAADATGHYLAMGLGKALFTTGDEPTTPGENCFNDNTPGNYHKLTTDVQTDGIVYTFRAATTGALAKVIFTGQRVFSFE